MRCNSYAAHKNFHRAIVAKMDEVEVKTTKIEIEVNQEKIDYINYVYNKEITYWKKAALERVLNDSEEKELQDLVPSRILLIREKKRKDSEY